MTAVLLTLAAALLAFELCEGRERGRVYEELKAAGRV